MLSGLGAGRLMANVRQNEYNRAKNLGSWSFVFDRCAYHRHVRCRHT
jgi:hypothetical protein